MAQDITYVGLGDLTYKSTEDGTLLVYGVATDPTLDVDRQICDPSWLKQAMPQWFTSGANVREQHSSIAAGVGVELAADGDKWMLKSEVVDPVTQTKVRKKVLKGYSIGIKGAQVIKDDAAPNGRIVGGTIVEVSLVDRPANPSARIEIAKSVNGELTMTELEPTADVAKGGPGSGPHPRGAGDLVTHSDYKAYHDDMAETHHDAADKAEAAGNRVEAANQRMTAELHENAATAHRLQAAKAGGDWNSPVEAGKISELAMAATKINPVQEGKSTDAEIAKGDVAKTSDLNAEAIETVDGAGDKAPSEEKRSCHRCFGQGEVVDPDTNDRVTCPVCNGSGEEPEDSTLHHINQSPSHPGADGNDEKTVNQSPSHPGAEKDADAEVTKGDVAGHEFHGNQYAEGGGAHTPAHEATRADAVKAIESYQTGWNGNQRGPELSAGNHSLEDAKSLIASGGTRDDLQAKADEARAYADKLHESNKQGFISGAAGQGAYPTSAELKGANIAEAQAQTLRDAGTMWDAIAKTNGNKSAEADVTAKGAEAYDALMADLEKRAFSKTEREHAAISGQALPSGAFPIKNIQDLKNAIQSFGRAKDKDAAKAHIIARAKALGQTNLIPDNWKNTEAETSKADHNPADLESVRTALISLIKSELDEIARGEENEIADVSELLTSLSIFLGWWGGEADEGETPAPFATTDTDDQPSGDDMAYIAMGVSPDLIKSATSEEATDEIRAELRNEIVKALGLDDSTTKAALAEAKEELTLLKAELAAVKEMAAPGGPALRQTQVQSNKSGQVDQLRSEADRLRKTASQVIDTSLRNAYIEKALKLEHDADAIARN